MADDHDRVISRIGNIGRWQARTIGIISIASGLTAWQTLIVGFLIPEIDFKCIRWENSTTKLEVDLQDIQLLQQESNTTEECLFREAECMEWEYSEYGNVVQQFNLICSRDVYRSLTSSLYMGGQIVGILLSGVLSDLFGRRKMMIIISLLLTISSCSTAAANSVESFGALRFFTAMFGVSLFTTSFVYSMELVGGIWNVYIGIGLEFPWAFAYMILPGIAYLIPNWSHLQLALSLPNILFTGVLLIPGLIPESPKWLLMHNRDKEAEEILVMAEKMNKREKSVKEQDLGTGAYVEPKSWSVKDILYCPHMIVCTLAMFFLWFTNSMVYYGLVLNSGTLMPGDRYINTLISGSLEVLAYALTIVVFVYGGRRFTQSGTLLFCGISLLLTLTTSDVTGKMALSQIGKLAITASFAMVYLYAAEIFPTVCRNAAMSFSSFFARIGSVIAPFAGRELGKVNPSLPIWLFGLCSIVAGVLSLVLPETKDSSLPDTLVEGETFLSSRPGLFRRCLPKKTEERMENKDNKAYERD